MRILTGVLLLLAAQAVVADDSDGFENFDSDTGLYFHPISEGREKKGPFCFSCDAANGHAVVNVFVYDPATKTARDLFSKSPGEIHSLIIESEYDAKERKMIFLGENSVVKNNKNIRVRKPNDQILVESYACASEKDCQHTVWKAGKKGGEPKVLFTFPDSEAEAAEWHLDVKNGVVRLLTRKGPTYVVREFAW